MVLALSSRILLASELSLPLLSLLLMLLFEMEDEDMTDQSMGSVLPPLSLLEPMLSR